MCFCIDIVSSAFVKLCCEPQREFFIALRWRCARAYGSEEGVFSLLTISVGSLRLPPRFLQEFTTRYCAIHINSVIYSREYKSNAD